MAREGKQKMAKIEVQRNGVFLQLDGTKMFIADLGNKPDNNELRIYLKPLVAKVNELDEKLRSIERNDTDNISPTCKCGYTGDHTYGSPAPHTIDNPTGAARPLESLLMPRLFKAPELEVEDWLNEWITFLNDPDLASRRVIISAEDYLGSVKFTLDCPILKTRAEIQYSFVTGKYKFFVDGEFSHELNADLSVVFQILYTDRIMVNKALYSQIEIDLVIEVVNLIQRRIVE
jgi:hypothetical protein